MSAYHGLPPISKIAEALGGEVIKGQVLAPGPGHSPEDRSLSVKLDDKAPDGFVTNSFAGDSPAACRDHVRVKLGLPEWKPNGGANGSGNASKQQRRVIAEFVYTDQKGTPCLRVSRTEPKGFFQSYWTGNSWKPGGTKAPPVPYRLVQLIAASPSQTIFIVEGEGKANLLAALGFVATSASGGAKAPWSPTLNKWFAGRPAVVLPDNDAPGKAYAEKVARNLHGTAASVKIVELPDLRPKGDIKQWLEGDPSGAKLAKLVAAAPLWEPTESTDGKDGGGGEGGDEESDDNLILELAALTSFQYAKRRRAAAKQLRIRAEDLDKAVAEVRAELVGKDEAPVLYEHWTVERWPEPVDGGALLQELTDCLKRYVVMTEDQALVVALWIIFTWLHEKIAVHSPLLLVTSPQANSGKSTLLGVINFLARRALQSVSISGPALFRSIEEWQPTFMIDEADTVLVHNEDLKEVVNSGWTRGQCVIRCDPDTHKPRPYSTFAPKAIGMKGRKLPDTTLSRAIIVAIKRKRPDEMTADFDHLDTEDLARLRQQIARWARDNTDALVGAEPESPVGFHNRVRANWRLLLGIAERVGGRWKLQAQRAARAVEEVHDTFDPAIGIQLLADIRTAFEALNTERMTSAVMIAELVKDEEGPWVEYGKGGTPITQKRLADLLKEFGIRRPHNVRPATGGQGKGYHRADFEDAWERYLPPGTVQTPSQSVPPSHFNNFNNLQPKQTVPAVLFGTNQNGANPLKTKQWDGGTLRKGISTVPREVGVADGPDPEGCLADDWAKKKPHTCVQCHGPPDGKEEMCSFGEGVVWLHRACQPHYLKALEEQEGLPW